MDEPKIKVKAMCLLTQDGFILVADGNSMSSNVRKVVPGNFYRVLGGSMNFDETVEEAVRREVREETEIEIEDLKFLNVVENRFVYAGEKGHEVVFLFQGKPKEDNLDKNKIIHAVDGDYEFDAVWVSIPELLKGPKPLYPDFDYSKILGQSF